MTLGVFFPDRFVLPLQKLAGFSDFAAEIYANAAVGYRTSAYKLNFQLLT